jgi:hypothetical protein
MSLTTTSCGQPGCAGCDCGGTVVQSQSFVRPRFFAGQLLTQDDFQVLDDYLTAKSRLHNRYLFGQGVACGLDVTCHPCGEGRVQVHPGYALDCCGNDIVVPCLEELDVNQLIRDLRVEARGGYDCGDPCADPAEASDEGPRHYCLLVRYGETLTDPQAPYATEEPCGAQTCEPSRVREGYRFLLRCRHEPAPHDDLAARVKACMGDPRTVGEVAAKGRRFQKYGQAMAPAAQAAGKPVAFEAADAQRFSTSLDALLEAGVGGDEKAAGAAAPADVREQVEHVRALASALVRFDLHDEAGQAELVKQHPDLGRDGEARRVLAAARQQLEPELEGAYPEPMDRAVAGTALAEAARWSDPAVPFELRRDRLEPRMLAQGAALDVALHGALRRDLAAVREWLLDRLDERPSASDCELRDKIAAVRVPAPDQEEALERSALLRTATAARELTEGQVRQVLDCLCAAINPPCPPCDDAAVPLACLEVRDCEVVEVCNASRTFLLSGPNVRYWVPYLGRMGEFLELACCGLPDSLAPRPDPGVGSTGDDVRLRYRQDLFEEAIDPGTERLATALLQPLDFTPPEVRQLLVAAASLGGIVGDARPDVPRALPAPTRRAAEPAGELLGLRQELDRLREELAAVRTDLAGEKRRITRLQRQRPAET